MALSLMCQFLWGKEMSCFPGPVFRLLWDMGKVNNFLLGLSWQLCSYCVLLSWFPGYVRGHWREFLLLSLLGVLLAQIQHYVLCKPVGTRKLPETSEGLFVVHLLENESQWFSEAVSCHIFCLGAWRCMVLQFTAPSSPAGHLIGPQRSLCHLPPLTSATPGRPGVCTHHSCVR